jgi:hypothetical protein
MEFHGKAAMPLLGSAAMLLSFDIAEEAVEEHDRWHTHEHLPERLSIPGFLRGSRWVASQGAPRYMVLYEVQALEVLTSPAYLARLDNPTPWTTAMMRHYRGMRRGLCAVAGSVGLGQGGTAALLRFGVDAAAGAGLQQWLVDAVLPRLPQQAGLSGAHLLQGAAAAPMTNEQRLRGADAGVDTALVITGYDAAAVAACAQQLAAAGFLPTQGARDTRVAVYTLSQALAATELAAAPH